MRKVILGIFGFILVFLVLLIFWYYDLWSNRANFEIGKIEYIIIYNYYGFDDPQINLARLEKYPSYTFNKSDINQAFSQIEYRKTRRILWKGSWLAIVHMNDGSYKRMLLSYNCAFFIILGERGYYMIEGSSFNYLKNTMQNIRSINWSDSKTNDLIENKDEEN